MIFNKKFLHAIEAVLDIAIYSYNSPTRATEITKTHNIPSRYLEKILQELVRQRILKGTRGPNGGYTLGKEKRNIYLIDIYNSILIIEKNKNIDKIDTDIRSKVITPLVEEVSDKIVEFFKATSIDDLYKKIKKVNVDINKGKKMDFTI